MKKKIIFCLLSLSLMIAGCQSNEIEDITPLSLIHISEPTRQAEISYAVFCLKKKKKNNTT